MLILIASCKKEEVVTCPEIPAEPYTSLMKVGDSASFRAKVFYMTAGENPNGCEGYFLDIYDGLPTVLSENGVGYHRIINTLPDYVVNHPDLLNAE